MTASTPRTIYEGDLVRELSVKAGVSERFSRQLLLAWKEVFGAHLVANNRVYLMGFGTFWNKRVGAKLLRNPGTGARVRVRAHLCPAWKPSDVLKRRVREASEK